MLCALNNAHSIEKLLLKNQVIEKFLHSEVNLIIQYIIVQDKDGQNNTRDATRLMRIIAKRVLDVKEISLLHRLAK